MISEFTITLIILAIIAVSIGSAIGIYNNLIVLRNQNQNARAQIDVQLKRRHDLIPNLMEAVKGYMAHEQNILTKVTELRQQAVNISGSDIKSVAQIENQLSSALKSLFAVAENYPDLKANQNFIQFQEELTSTENKISFARQFFNDTVLNYNNKIQTFPDNIIAGMFNFSKENYFEIPEIEKNAPVVKF